MFLIPNYISTVSYKINSSDSRTYITNEKSGFYVLLDGESSDFFYHISKINSYDDFLCYVEKNYLSKDDVESFINQLIELGILLDDSQNITTNQDSIKQNTSSFVPSRPNEDELKQFYGEMESWQCQNGFLSDLFIEMTHNCNLRCIHCFQNDHSDKTEITFESIKPVIDEAIKLGVYKITLSGGECTLSKDFIDIVKYIREKRLQLIIYTNGLFLYDNPEILYELVSVYPHLISLSLYSMNPAIHDKITGVKGSHEKTLSVIKTLKEKDLYVSIKCFLTHLNADNHQEVIEFAEKNGLFASVDFSFLNNVQKGNDSVQITDSQIYNLMKDKKSLLHASTFNPIVIDEKFLNRQICRAGQQTLTIQPNLDVIFCPSYNIVLGNLKDNSLYEIWKSEISLECQSKCQKDLVECYKEEFCKFCTYCPSFAIAEGKYLKKSQSLCRIAKLKYQAFQELNGVK